MRRVKASPDWERIFDVDRDPMTEGEPLPQKRTQREAPFWQVPKKQRAARLQYTDHRIQPTLAPLKILVARFCIVDTGTILLSQIERGIGERQIDRFRL